jgi:hypothetical protein
MPLPKHLCAGCGIKSHGIRCKKCDSKERARLADLATFQGGYKSSVAIEGKQPTVGPWWIGLSREELQVKAHKHAARMSRGVSGNYRSTSEMGI